MKKAIFFSLGVAMVTAGVTEVFGLWQIAESADTCFKFGACATIMGFGTSFAVFT